MSSRVNSLAQDGWLGTMRQMECELAQRMRAAAQKKTNKGCDDGQRNFGISTEDERIDAAAERSAL